MTRRTLWRARLGLGVAHLAAPGFGARALTGRPFDRNVRAVVRVLGARQVAQAIVSGTRPSAAVLALGAGVDAVHSLSMLSWALVDRTHRRPALGSALLAGGFSLAGLRAARSSREYPSPLPVTSLGRLRDETEAVEGNA
ncbi:MAG: hypothetical protein ACRDYY_12565 [Acidimicrobiales bacterium]